MAGRYVPPALRMKHEALSKENTRPEAQPSPSQSAFDHPPSRDNKRLKAFPPFAPGDQTNCYSAREIYEHFWKGSEASSAQRHSATLHGSAATPETLSFIFLFQGANSKWNSDKIIFVKSNLNLLPALQLEDKRSSEASHEATTECSTSSTVIPASPSNVPVPHPPIAVFAQGFSGSVGRNFRFAGWYHIARLELLEPRSEALVRMLHKKWEVKDRYGNAKQRKRDKKAWEEGLQHKWAVVKMEIDKQAAVRGAPEIEKINGKGDEEGKKSVHELLREMRLGKERDGKSEACVMAENKKSEESHEGIE